MKTTRTLKVDWNCMNGLQFGVKGDSCTILREIQGTDYDVRNERTREVFTLAKREFLRNSK